MAEPRSGERRKADTSAMVARPAIDVRVATAGAPGVAHLVPLSLVRADERVFPGRTPMPDGVWLV